MANEEWGPLAPLIGTWEGDKGLDVSYHHAEDKIGDTPYREQIVFKPFGPVGNGTQELYGLDYRMAAWRTGGENPFHTEVGYWLWDARDQQVMRCFMVPRATVMIAGGHATADATTFTMTATAGDNCYGVLENQYLAKNASTKLYEVTITVNDDESFSYTERTVLDMAHMTELYDHTDTNTLRRVAD